MTALVLHQPLEADAVQPGQLAHVAVAVLRAVGRHNLHGHGGRVGTRFGGRLLDRPAVAGPLERPGVNMGVHIAQQQNSGVDMLAHGCSKG